MQDIFSYVYPNAYSTLNQFFGVRAAASNLCFCGNPSGYTAAMFLADWPQFSKIVKRYDSSTFTRDPSNVGGSGVTVTFEGFTAYVSGSIAYYPEDIELGRPAGNRVGFQILAPDDLEDVSQAVIQINGGDTILLADDPNVSGNPRIFWWYPLVVEDTTQHVLIIDWDGLGPRLPETFTINYSNFTLETEDNSPGRLMPISMMTRADTTSTDDVESVLPEAILDMFIVMANAAIQECRWGVKWRWAMGLYIAHYATLYLRSYSPASEDGNPSSAAGSGGVTGVLASAKLGDASLTYDVSSVVSATEDWGAWNSTTYGQQLVTEARLVALGGTYVI